MTTDSQTARAPHIDALKRHFGDLRDGTHGTEGDTVSRAGKERHFGRGVELLDPYAFQVLQEFNTTLLHGEGTVEATGLQRTPDRGLGAGWSLSWSEQRQAGI